MALSSRIFRVVTQGAIRRPRFFGLVTGTRQFLGSMSMASSAFWSAPIQWSRCELSSTCRAEEGTRIVDVEPSTALRMTSRFSALLASMEDAKEQCKDEVGEVDVAFASAQRKATRARSISSVSVQKSVSEPVYW